jgi:hypothetical protein
LAITETSAYLSQGGNDVIACFIAWFIAWLRQKPRPTMIASPAGIHQPFRIIIALKAF